MTTYSSHQTPDIRSSMQRRPTMLGRIEKAQNPKQALVRLALYLSPYKV